jgi:MSHA biogenesis protein MshL
VKIQLSIGILGLLLLLGGCSSVGPRTAMSTDSVDESVTLLEEGIAENARIAELQRQASQALLEALMPPEAEETALAEPRFNLQVNQVSAQEFFRGLVQDTPYNMVVHPDVEGVVSLDLKDVSVPEVMEIMREVYGYDYTRGERLLQVYPDALRTEIFQINYLNVERSGRSEMQVSAGKVSDTNGSRRNRGYSNVDGDAAFGGQRGRGTSGGSVVGTSVSTGAETNFWAELRETLTAIVAEDAGSQVVVNPQVGLAVVRARPNGLHAVRSYLGRVENTLHRQVILEAKVIEVTLREGFQAGINWNTFGDESGGTFKPTTRVDAAGNVVTTPGSEHSVAGEFLPGSAADFFNQLGSAFTLNASFGDFEAAIELLKTQGSVQVLSSPRIATVNNQKAVIKVGDDEFFVTDISTNTVTAGSAINTVDSPELTPFFSGIALDVTPQISESGDVILHIHPTVSEVREQLKTISGEQVPLAASQIRESDSIVRAANGQIVVIGGLMQNSSEDNNARVPGLGRIPGIGYLFKQKAQTGIKSELVILLKPIVVQSQEHSDFIKRSMDRMERLKRDLNSRG